MPFFQAQKGDASVMSSDPEIASIGWSSWGPFGLLGTSFFSETTTALIEQGDVQQAIATRDVIASFCRTLDIALLAILFQLSVVMITGANLLKHASQSILLNRGKDNPNRISSIVPSIVISAIGLYMMLTALSNMFMFTKSTMDLLLVMADSFSSSISERRRLPELSGGEENQLQIEYHP